MAFYDIFNGDADGICALHQLRLAQPRDAQLVTGVKRDIQLLARVDAGAGDVLTVLDVSLHENRADLDRLLERGARCVYFDHHYAGELPRHAGFEAHIDTAPDVCTSLLVDRHLGGAHRAWAVVAAFGDNLFEAAKRAAAPLALPDAQLRELRELGECINYNAYGESPEDLHFHPADLYRRLGPYRDPLAFMREDPAFITLREGYAADVARAQRIAPLEASAEGAVFVLPDAAWSRRVSGVFGNLLARGHPERAHAVLVPKSGGAFTVSVRAPRANPVGADELCRQFPTGGGRKAAGGINHLPADQMEAFTRAFARAFARA
ncbi:MAG: acetyltransferase [Pseudomonadota bacterium]